MPIAPGGAGCAAPPHVASSTSRPSSPSSTPPWLLDDWRRYKRTGSLSSRNRLVAFYMASHVRPIATRLHATLPNQVELDDLVQQGYLGLIDAMDRFDIDRCIRFETFSRRRIYGAVQDYLRSIDPVPRLSRTRSKQFQAAHERFQKEHGRPPSDEELRPMLGVEDPAFRRYLTDREPAMVVPFSNVPPAAGDDPDADSMDAFEDRADPGPVRRMHEVGRTIGISESRVSQRIDSILARLRARLLTDRETNGVIGEHRGPASPNGR
jgi:RNA polymerase sigma factor for flagellar operon FliA